MGVRVFVCVFGNMYMFEHERGTGNEKKKLIKKL